VLQSDEDVRGFLRWVLLIHLVGLMTFVLAAASVLLQDDVLFGGAAGGVGVVALAASYGRRRWLLGYIEEPISALARWFAGNMPALRAFDRALLHAGAFRGVDGRVWVRANRVVVYGCFSLWAAIAVLQAIRGEQ
jgi:hypothetical protein